MSPQLRNRVMVGDVRQRLAELPEASVDCVITSPPYFQLRDYGITGQIGLEGGVDEWVSELRIVLNGLTRVLKPTGSLWLNLGDTYSRHARFGASRKSLILAPERLLLALARDGWVVRNKVIWAKTNPVPHAVADRLNCTYDVMYFLTRQPSYWFDLDAIRLPHGSGVQGELGKNPGDVWQIAGANFPGEHFATFPPKLVERPLLATCPELVCDACVTPYRRESHRRRESLGRDLRPGRPNEPRVLRYEKRYRVIHRRGRLRPTCTCGSTASPGVVLDPFFGAGTVGLVAEQHDRDWVGIEINPRYAEIAKRRLDDAHSSRGDGPPVVATADVVVTADQPSIPGRGK